MTEIKPAVDAVETIQTLGIALQVEGVIECLFTSKLNAELEFGLYSDEFKPQIGQMRGITALVKRSSTSLFGHRCVFSHPFSVKLRKAQENPLGWPIFAIYAYEITFMGEDKLIGYGFARLPMENGRHRLEISLTKPKGGLQLFGGGQHEFANYIDFIKEGDRRSVESVSYGDKAIIEIEIAISK